MNIMILGSGGREHALAWKISKSKLCDNLYIAPGNGGTSLEGENISIDINNFKEIKNHVLIKNIDLVIVGPEEPLVRGIVDYFKHDNELKNIKIFGPGRNGAKLEGSKDFSKEFMFRNNIPCGKSKTFNKDNLENGYKFLEKIKPPYVLKADGLAAGKGVLILDDLEEAKKELSKMILDEKFGDASKNVLVEEYLDGIEVSVFAITDGNKYLILPEAKDYKRIGEKDTGPNTGGMGAVSPVNFADEEFMKKVEDQVIKRTVNGIQKENLDYKGFIFAGLMNVKGNPYVIEYNVRMGDPETQVVIPRIKNDLLDIINNCLENNLEKLKLDFDERYATTVILAADGYPNNYNKGDKINNLSEENNTKIFHAGTKRLDNEILSNGGRVLACTGFGKQINEALSNSYNMAKKISWKNKYFRNDIGKDLI
ncbi:MAG: phosphoribosylamine--glycine ligase [Rhodothermaeota bacterium MED-G19]|nr:MAG: phosphoribosylamine--glycine ligase [Rhodothermaeota bacterium MED-G19]